MPIQLSNHRTSNAKLFSVAPNKQKLHTASSLKQTQKNNLKVSKNSSGSGLALVNRMFGNPTNAVPTVAPPPSRSNSRRRNSLASGSSHHDAAAGKADGDKKTMRRTGSLDTTITTPPPLGIPPPLRVGRSSSHGGIMDNNSSRSSQSSSSSRRKTRRVKSLGTQALLPLETDTRADSTMKLKIYRRGSGDSAATAPEAAIPNKRSSCDATIETNTNKAPASPRDTMRLKREQLRRKSTSNLPVPVTPPSSVMNLLDDFSDPSDSYCSDDSFLFATPT